MRYHEFKEILYQFSHIYFYGAGVIAFGAYKAIQELFHIKAQSFLVTERKEQDCQIEGIPIIGIRYADIDRIKSLIVLAVPEEYHNDMEQTLKTLGYLNYIKLDSQMEYVLMGNYLKKVRGLNLIEDCLIENPVKDYSLYRVYMAVSHKDQSLQEKYEEKPWVKKIQVGAALTTARIANLTDEGEDSLSDQNDLYGELTAAYYVWKHNDHAVTGLFHYRRILDVTEEQLGLLWLGKVDVILPLPFVCSPNASGQYGRYLLTEDVEIMLEVLKEKEAEDFLEIKAILKRQYLYNYNMLIARKEIFDHYCRWLFPLLQEIAYRCEKTKRNRQPRYIGRIGEVLTSVYFMQNEKKLRIVHAKKVWRV